MTEQLLSNPSSERVIHTPSPLYRWRQYFWRIPAWCAAALVLLPITVIAFSWLSWDSAQAEVWQHLWETQLLRLLSNTLLLIVGVGLGVVVLGVGLAWLTAVCEFPGRCWLDWALMLPLAVPSYVFAFVMLGLFEFSGPVQSFWRGYFGTLGTAGGAVLEFPTLSTGAAVVGVFVLVLYPYVYLLARSSFVAQGRRLMDASRLLGRGALASFALVALPMARPAIAAGTALALMETLADFGTVAVFNFDTFTTAIYKSWFGFFNLDAAAQLASLLLLFVAIALYGEQRIRSGGRVARHVSGDAERYLLRGWIGWACSGACFLVVLFAFAIPLIQLLLWAWGEGFAGFDLRFSALVWNSVALGGMAALLTAGLALLVAYGQRLIGRIRVPSLSVRLAGLGYALPGSVLAVGIMISFTALERHFVQPIQSLFGYQPSQWLVGSLAALLLVYGVRFFSVAFAPIQSSFESIRNSYQEVAQTLGVGQWRLIWRLYLPLLSPGLLAGVLLVWVDTMKEMPATLLLRPFGWDTLAVRIYEMTSEGQWERAALSALMLVLLSIGPVILMMRRSRFN